MRDCVFWGLRRRTGVGDHSSGDATRVKQELYPFHVGTIGIATMVDSIKGRAKDEILENRSW